MTTAHDVSDPADAAGRRTLPPARGTTYAVGFVCLGNICRSPMADVVLSRLVREAGLGDRVMVSSCGTGPWHVGEPIDPRAGATLTAAGYDASAHRGRQLDRDWLELDLLLAMDDDNLAGVRGLGADPERARLFRSFDPLVPEDEPVPDVPDPYFGGEEGFTEVLAMVERTCARLLDELRTAA